MTSLTRLVIRCDELELVIGDYIANDVVKACLRYDIPIFWDYKGLVQRVPSVVVENASQYYDLLEARRPDWRHSDNARKAYITWDDLVAESG